MAKSVAKKPNSKKPASKSLDFDALTPKILDDLWSLSQEDLTNFIQQRIRKTADRQRFIEILKAHKGPKQRMEENLHSFVEEFFDVVCPGADFIDGEHIYGICAHLDHMQNTPHGNLLINIPPGCMKSLLCNVFFPAKVWTTWPEARFLHATYGEPLSIRDSLLCRNIVESEKYKAYWGDRVQLTAEQNQKLRFDNTAKGWRIATTVHGRGTGEHPHFLIGDDVLSAQDANSEAERLYVNDAWFDQTMSTRGVGIGSRRIIIGQRLHQSDLPGHILKNHSDYIHLCLPMEYEPDHPHLMKETPIGWNDWRTTPGQLLWPQFLNREVVEKTKIALGPWQVPGQYQQRPTPKGGGVIKVERFGDPVDALPNDCVKFVRYWDKAATLGTGDWSAGVLMTYSPSLRLCFVVDVQKGQWEYEDRNRIMKQSAKIDADKYGLFNVLVRGEQEPGSGGKESAMISMKELSRYNAVFEKPSGDKIDRAGPLAGQINAGNVRLLAGGWNRDYIRELEVFPVGDHDDQVDASSGAYNNLQRWLGFDVHTSRNVVIDMERTSQQLPPEPEPDIDDPVFPSHRLGKILQEVGYFEGESEYD